MNTPVNVPWTQKTTVVLVGPQLAVNVGAVARAMGNFGLRDLRLVTPRDGWPKDQARTVASGAEEIIDHAQVFHSLGAAIADVPWTLAMTRRSRRHPMDSLDIEDLPAFLNALRVDAHQNSAHQSPAHQNPVGSSAGESPFNTTMLALIAGCEMAGLSNEQIAICRATVCIDTDEKSPSMNLSHAVAVACHYVRRAQTLPLVPLAPVGVAPTPPNRHDDSHHGLGRLFENADPTPEDDGTTPPTSHLGDVGAERESERARGFFVPVPATSEQIHRTVTEIERAIHSTHAYTMVPKRALWRQRLHRTLRLCLSDQRHLGLVRHVLATIAGSPRHYEADKRLWPLVAFYFEISASSPLADMIEDVHTHWQLPPALTVTCLWLGVETRIAAWTSFVEVFFEHAPTIDAWRRLHSERSLLSHVDVGILSLVTHTLHHTLDQTCEPASPRDNESTQHNNNRIQHAKDVKNAKGAPHINATASQLERCTVAMRFLQEAREHWECKAHKNRAPSRAWLLSHSAVAWRDQIMGMIQSRGH